MAIYEFICRYCQFECDVIRPMREATNPCYCGICGNQMDRQVELPARVPVGKYGKGNR